ncbi:MAG TPA: hypothetical protein ENF36_05960 [Desulfobacteraceae bacterium]|nr:hypothetical protein [Desulfobacteraceae bacterium]
MEEGKEIFRGIFKRSIRLAYEEERAIKKALMLYKWISPSHTREIENDFFIYSGAIKRVGEDFSWLAERLHKYCRTHYDSNEETSKETGSAKEDWQVRPFWQRGLVMW